MSCLSVVNVPKFGEPGDLLNRERVADLLCSVADNCGNISVVLLDAQWGDGKTTFIHQTIEREQDRPCVLIDAFEGDLVGDPISTVAYPLSIALKNAKGGSEAQSDFLQGARAIGLAVGKGVPRLLSAVAVKQLIGEKSSVLEEIEEDISEFAGDALKDFLKGNASDVEKFQKQKAQIHSALSLLREVSGGNKRPIVFIDELDRCRPDYAIEVLEVMKHIFANDDVLFVLSVDKHQLEQVIKGSFGNNFDAHTYLERFFSLQVQLPKRVNLSQVAVERFAERSFNVAVEGVPANPEYIQKAREIFTSVCRAKQFSLRRISRCADHIGLICKLLDGKMSWGKLYAMCVLVPLKYSSEKLYNEVSSGNVKVELLRVWLKDLDSKHNLDYICTILENYLTENPTTRRLEDIQDEREYGSTLSKIAESYIDFLEVR